MMKKVLAFLLVLALAAGVLATATTATASDAVDYRVGYSKVDINPYWSIWEATGGSIPTDLKNYDKDQNGKDIDSFHLMPMPMGGYGGNTHRLSRPELIDDNGSGDHAEGVIYLANNRYTKDFAYQMFGGDATQIEEYKTAAGIKTDDDWGQNDGDGIYATCVAIRQNPTAEPVLMFSVDFIGMSNAYCGLAKNAIIRALKDQGIHITADRILINATHTHGSIYLPGGFDDSTTYKQKLFGFDDDLSFDKQPEKYVPFQGAELDSYLSTYRSHLYNQLAAAAVKALTDGENNGEVTMEKGTVDVFEATGYTLNGVRHRKNSLTTNINGTDEKVDYVTGSSFNVGLAAEANDVGVSESNDELHIIKFSFPGNSGIEPIVMINWRAHTTANNKMGSKAYNNLSADFVAPLRYQLEQWGYRPILAYGTSGNLGMGNYPKTFNISFSASDTTMPATKYGYTLAYAVAGLAGSTHEGVAAWKTARVSELDGKRGTTTTSSSYKTWNPVYTQVSNFSFPKLTGCTQGPILLESTYYSLAPQTSTDAEYQASLYHDALAKSEGGSASNDGGLKLEKSGYPFLVTEKSPTVTLKSETTSEDGIKTETITEVSFSQKVVTKKITKDGVEYGEQPEPKVTEYNAKTGRVVLASQYHSNSLSGRHGTVNTRRISLCAFTLGDQVAFVTMPFEASDRYSADATLETADMYNDWNNLIDKSKWGTPFAVSLVNGSEGYVPNNLAYTYDKDLETRTVESILAGYDTQLIVAGSYEAHNTYTAAGEGEIIVDKLNTLLRSLSDGQAEPALKTEYCQHCKTDATWVPLDDKVMEDSGNYLPTGHYYLAENYTTTDGELAVGTNETVCLDLNGKTYYSNTNTGVSRVLMIYGVMNVQDSAGGGTIKGKAISGKEGGSVYVSKATKTGVFNLYSGTVTSESGVALHGGSVYVLGEMNMYGGAVTGGKANFGGNIYVSTEGVFNLREGTVSGGTATCYEGKTTTEHDGGNVYAANRGVFNMYGGTVSGGNCLRYGGNMSAQHSSSSTPGGIFNMYGGTVTAGTAANTSYANVMISGNSTFRFNGGYIPNGVFMQGTMLLGSNTVYPVNEDVTAVSIKNSGTVKLDGIFAGKVKLTYPTTPTQGGTLGAVEPGSWIDHVNGAKISVANVTGYEGVVDGNLLKLGTKPAYGTCEACGATVVWMPLVEGATIGHFAMTGDLTDMAERTISKDERLCLNLNGHSYTATGRAFAVNGALNVVNTTGTGTVQGTAVDKANGGTIIVHNGGAFGQYSGTTLTCQQAENAKIASGGVVYVENGGSYTLQGGTITGGHATNGGNMFVATGAELVLNNGTITEGTAAGNGGNVHVAGCFTMNGGNLTSGTAKVEGGTGTYMGGNVFASGSFTLNGGSISGGSATYGGNVQAQGATAVFTMTGGSVSGGTGSANICTGQSSGSGLSTFRMEGGSISGGVWVQGYAVLTGTTNGTVNITVRNPADRLTIDGIYTGNINLTLRDGTHADGDKIGNAIHNADISGATITVTGAEATQYVVVVDGELRMGGKTYTGVSINTDAVKKTYVQGESLDTAGLVVNRVYSDGSTEVIASGYTITGYDPEVVGVQTVTVTYGDAVVTFEVTVAQKTYAYYVNGQGYDDLAAAMEASSSRYPLVLNADVTDMALSKNLYLELNGHHVTSVTTNGKKLIVSDASTDDYIGANYGTVPASANAQAASDYLAVTDGNVTSFHKYQLEMTSLVVNISEDVRGITYKSVFRGDAMVQSRIKEFGVGMRAYNAPNETSIWSDPDCKTHVALGAASWITGDNDNELKSVYVENIISTNLAPEVNQLRSEVVIYGRAYIQLTDGTMLFSNAVGFSMQDAMKQMDDWWNGDDTFPGLSDTAKNKLVAFYKTYESFMKDWDLPHIQATANPISEENTNPGDIVVM